MAYYPLDGSPIEATGSGRDGTVFGAVPTEDRGGHPACAYHFQSVAPPGPGDYISANGEGLPTAERTVAVWFRAEESVPAPVVVGYGGGACGTSFFMGFGFEGFQGYFMGTHCNTHDLIYPTDPPPVDVWTHFAVVIDALHSRLYVGGDLKAQNNDPVTDTATGPGTQLGIGVASSPDGAVPYVDGNIGFFAGDLDDVRIYDRALSDGEVKALAEEPSHCGGGCDAAPTSGCRLGVPGKSTLQLKDSEMDAKDQFAWKWNRGDATAASDFADPLGTSATYTVCLYDASANSQPLLASGVAGGGTCGEKPCWKLQGNATKIKGFKYKSKTGIPAGVTDLKLQAGEAGKAKVQTKGKGAALALPALDLTLPVTIQLLVDDGLSTRCWQNTFTTFDKNTLGEFKAKGP